MKIYRTANGVLIEEGNSYWLIEENWDTFVNDDNLHDNISKIIRSAEPNSSADTLKKILPPVGEQEVWGAGVTYMRSRKAREEESQDAGGGDFYARVYEADRPEIFFKNTAHRIAGQHQSVRIRSDSKWNVPEPELTLLVSSSGKLLGYTIGNDMSSRDIEGENPLYLPQAKTYDKSGALGPGILITSEPLPSDTSIQLEINRGQTQVFRSTTEISQMKRSFMELIEYLFKETGFPKGCLLMTGTGIIPPAEFTLEHGDEIRISIDHIGTLINYVE
jgi:2-dehydro-3-deoxy-D-arabinonate dehydratase